MKRRNIKIFMCFILIISVFLTTGFTEKRLTPQTVYRVYLKGESLGLIKSKNN